MVFLQHPRERRVPIGTCRMAHLSLPNSELHIGLHFDGDARLEALAAEPGTMVLFPSPQAVDAAELPPGALKTLIVVDGTWSQARKVVERNAVLRKLPCLGLTPSRPGNYRIRQEPAAHCLSTVEAVVEVLGQLEGDAARFRPMLKAFDRMVELQLAHVQARLGGLRYRRLRQKLPKARPLDALLPLMPQLVAVYAESNARSFDSRVRGTAELVQLVAQRLDGTRFSALIAPRRELSPGTPFQLELPPAQLLSGEPIEAALARWQQFLRPGDVLCSWGRYAVELLRKEGAAHEQTVDLRDLMARQLNRRAGALEEAGRWFDGAPAKAPWAPGRAGRRLAGLMQVLQALEAERPLAQPPEALRPLRAARE